MFLHYSIVKDGTDLAASNFRQIWKEEDSPLKLDTPTAKFLRINDRLEIPKQDEKSKSTQRKRPKYRWFRRLQRAKSIMANQPNLGKKLAKIS